MKTIKEYPVYAVTEDGKVWSYKSNKFMKLWLNKGYLMVGLRKNGKTYSRLVSRLIAQTYIPNPSNLPEVDHGIGGKLDNSILNLSWVSSKENKRRAWRDGLYENTRRQSASNIEKVNKDRRKGVKRIKDDEIVIYPTILKAANEVGTSTSNICKVLKGKMKTCKGYYWEYI